MRKRPAFRDISQGGRPPKLRLLGWGFSPESQANNASHERPNPQAYLQDSQYGLRPVNPRFHLICRVAQIHEENNMGRLEGKIALITGGNSGIGFATAKRFVEEGAYVFITGRRESELAAAASEIGGNVTAIQGDVSNLADLDRLFAQVEREKGRLDIVFANAGVAKFATLGEITEELYDWTFDINVKGVVFTVQKALPFLPEGASIILNASIVASKGLPMNSVYSATKAALRSFARSWTSDLKHRRIRVNAISPGVIDTPGLASLLASAAPGPAMTARA
jgi:NAD(P)-dependent dehydrogenase (short-subunit alcohol dehydrogenase family)